MKRIFFVVMLVALFFPGLLSAVTVRVVFENSQAATTLAPAIPSMQMVVAGSVMRFNNMPDFARGSGNANTYASHAATLRGYQGYSTFALAAGSMLSFQAPDRDPLFLKELPGKLGTDKSADSDIYAGAAGTPLAVHCGLNLSFLVEDLYLSFKFGKFDSGFDVPATDAKMNFNSNIAGFFLNYQIVKQKSVLSGGIVWRGFSVETGVIYSDSITRFYCSLDPINGFKDGTTPFTFDIDPSLDIHYRTKNLVVPAELYTSLRLLYILNVGIGGGIDYVPRGSTDMKLLSAGGVKVTDDGASNASGLVGTKGRIFIDGDIAKNEKSDKYRAKGMANLGLTLGAVFIDIPLTYYFSDNGYAAGISAGIVW